MARLAATVGCTVAALANGIRLASPGPGAATGFNMAPLPQDVPWTELRNIVEAWPRGAEDDAHCSVSRELAELLGLDGAVEQPDVLEGDEEDVHSRVSRGLATAFDLHGRAAEVSTPLVQHLLPLMNRADLELRVELMSWAIYDKLRRALKVMVPKPFREESDEFFRMISGVELHALEAMKLSLERAEHLGDDHPAARQAHAAALKYLAEEIRRGVQDSAQFSLSVGKGAFERLLRQGRHSEAAIEDISISIADAIPDIAHAAEPSKEGEVWLFRKISEASDGALSEAAEIDVTLELMPQGAYSKNRLKLLGLIGALGHETVFREVQEALDPSRIPMTINGFMKKMRVRTLSELVKLLIHKYTTPDALLRTYLSLYSVTQLRNDPGYFQLAWGPALWLRAAVNRVKDPVAQAMARRGLHAFENMEACYHGAQFAGLSWLAMQGIKTTKLENLLAAHGFLTLLLFVIDMPKHLFA